MNHFKPYQTTRATCEFCPALLQAERFRGAYRKAANKAVDWILVKWGEQQAGKLVHLDGVEIAALVDELLSIEDDDLHRAE